MSNLSEPIARDILRNTFLASSSFAGAELEALPADASFRCYFRLHGTDRPALLMDAPPPQEDIRPFIKVARHLNELGLRAPRLYECDVQHGFLLLEDFGDNTYTRLLSAGTSETELYELAIDVLTVLHRAENAADIDIPSYDTETLIDEAMLFIDWYVPELTGLPASDSLRAGFVNAWRSVLHNLPDATPSLVLRDFHVDNLMILSGQSGISSCGLLDFQDALIGPAAYDVVSLLEDARRDISPDLTASMLERYRQTMELDTDATEGFMSLYRVLGAQRHCKVLGIFVRLWRRDGKDVYIRHLPRVARLLLAHLSHPDLAPLSQWMDKELPGLLEADIDREHAVAEG